MRDLGWFWLDRKAAEPQMSPPASVSNVGVTWPQPALSCKLAITSWCCDSLYAAWRLDCIRSLHALIYLKCRSHRAARVGCNLSYTSCNWRSRCRAFASLF